MKTQSYSKVELYQGRLSILLCGDFPNFLLLLFIFYLLFILFSSDLPLDLDCMFLILFSAVAV